MPQRKCCQVASGLPGPDKADATLYQGLGTATSSLVTMEETEVGRQLQAPVVLALMSLDGKRSMSGGKVWPLSGLQEVLAS